MAIGGKTEKASQVKKNDVLWMTSDSWNLNVIDEFQWIASSGVFSQRSIEIVDFLGDWVSNNVFKNSTELDSVIDFWLFIFTKANTFSIASSFHVEDTLVSPDVFIITDKESVTDSAQSGFTSS